MIFTAPFKFLRDTVLRIGAVPNMISGQVIPDGLRSKLQKSIDYQAQLNNAPKSFFICVRSGQMLSNQDMHISHFENRRWVPVPKAMADKANLWDRGKRAKWARWVGWTLMPRLKAKNQLDQLERLACEF